MKEKEKKYRIKPSYFPDLENDIRSSKLKESFVSDDNTDEAKNNGIPISVEENEQDQSKPGEKNSKDDSILDPNSGEGDLGKYIQEQFNDKKVKFEVNGKIGKGGNAPVYQCKKKYVDSQIEEFKAVKVIVSRNEIDSIRSMKEIKCQYKYKGRSEVVSIDDYKTHPLGGGVTLIMICMECMDGSLRNLLEMKHHFNLVEVVDFGIKFCDLLKDMEAENDHHNDIKPENIMYKKNQNQILYKLGDFGSARNDDDTLTESEKGTPIYMPPSRETSDTYSLGLVLLEMLRTRKHKPEEKNNNTFDFTGIDADLAEILRKACYCDINKKNNFLSASEFKCMLDNWRRKHADEVNLYEADMSFLYKTANDLKEDDERSAGFSAYSERTIRYFIGAAEKNSMEAMYQLYQIEEGKKVPGQLYDKEKALQYLERSAEGEYAPAMNALACRMIREKRTVEQKAEDLLRKSAETYPPAQYNLALMIRSGMVNENNMEEAEQLLAQAAEGGYEPADRLLKAAGNTKGDKNS